MIRMPLASSAVKTTAGIMFVIFSCCLISCGAEPNESGLPAQEAASPGARVEEGPAGDAGQGEDLSAEDSAIAEDSVAAAEPEKGPAAQPDSQLARAEEEHAQAGEEPARAANEPAAAAAASSAPAAADPPSPQPVHVSAACSALANATNSCRSQAGVPELPLDAKLCKAAQVRADEMAAARKLSHTRPDGSSCFTVYDQCGIDCESGAENIADGFTSAQAACDGFRGSPTHYKNMVSSVFTKLGVGMAKDSAGICYWVQLFSD